MRTLDDVWAEIENASRRKRAYWFARRNWRRLLRSPHAAVAAIHCAWQRLTRGWDYRSVWGLDTYIGRTLGAQLVYMADIAHGWPCSEQHPTFEGWVAEMRSNGQALLAYAVADSLDDGWTEDVKIPAQDALRWVADNLPALWD